MPPSERLEEIGALATIVDENRFRYGLDALCAWRGLPGKDETVLREAVKAAGFKVTKQSPVQSHIWQMPARVVGPYAEADAANTLALFESLNPVLDKEGTRDAYRLEGDLLPMVSEMRRRGIRVDTGCRRAGARPAAAEARCGVCRAVREARRERRHGGDRPQQVAGGDLRCAGHRLSGDGEGQSVIHRRLDRLDAQTPALASAADRQSGQVQQRGGEVS